jgi:hypothetical protein
LLLLLLLLLLLFLLLLLSLGGARFTNGARHTRCELMIIINMLMPVRQIVS